MGKVYHSAYELNNSPLGAIWNLKGLCCHLTLNLRINKLDLEFSLDRSKLFVNDNSKSKINQASNSLNHDLVKSL